MSFVNLHHHDTYSRLDGYRYPTDAAQRAKALGMPALAQTNHGNMFGAFDHYKACKAAGIVPILGMEAYLAPGPANVRERAKWGEIQDVGRTKMVPGPYTHLTILAQNATGLKNLYQLHAKSYLDGYYYEPRVDRAMLEDHSKGLIVLSGCAGSEISVRIRLGQFDEARKTAEYFAEVFEGRFFIEIMKHGLDFEDKLNRGLIDLSKQLDIPLVATQDTHYVHESDANVHDALLCIQTITTLADEKRFRFSGEGYYLKSALEMSRLFVEAPEAVTNTVMVAEMIESYDEIFEHQNLMPQGDFAVLEDRANEGLYEIIKDRIDLEPTSAYTERLDYELEVIDTMGYSGYFLTLAEIMREVRLRGIFSGNGRGSGAASLAAYCLGITNIDPLEHGLVFERFLNPERTSPPDIDTDFVSHRHKEVFDIATELFGADHVARLITFGTIATKRAVQDAAKILGYEAKDGARFKAYVPPPRRGRTVSLAEVPELKAAQPDVYALALGIEGQIRQPGIHAGGCIISPVPLSSILPVKQSPSDPGLISGFVMEEVEELGLCKLDFLAVKNLDVIETTLEFING